MKRAWPWFIAAAVAAGLAWRIAAQSTWEHDDLIRAAAAAYRADDLTLAEARARQSLALRPLDGRAYRILARIALARDNQTAGEALTRLAVQYSPRDTGARELAARQAVEHGDVATAIGHYDHWLRVYPEDGEDVFPELLTLSATPAGRDALVARLALRPEWRTPLLRYYAQKAAAASDLPALFHALASHGGLDHEEMQLYLARFISDKQWAAGRDAWLAELPANRRQRQDIPVDGDFDGEAPSGSPFEWQFARNGAVDVGVVTREDNTGAALRAAFIGQRSSGPIAQQLLLLEPGSYTLQWESRLESLDTPRGLKWLLTCVDGQGGNLLLNEPLKGSSPWQAHRVDFDVPQSCSAQWLRLDFDARIAAETLATGVAWFDNVHVVHR